MRISLFFSLRNEYSNIPFADLPDMVKRNKAKALNPSLGEIDFVGERLNNPNGAPNSNDNLKKLILITKYWLKNEVKPKYLPEFRFPSYILELICIDVWEKKLQLKSYDLLEWFYEVVKVLKDYRSISCHWTEKYHKFDIYPASLLTGELE